MTRTVSAREAALRQQRHRDETVVAKDDFAALLASEQGRRIAWRILDQCLVHAPVFHTNAMQMSANAGKQELGLWLQRELQGADLTNYLKMQEENGS